MDQLENPDQTPAFALTARIPQRGHTVWGCLGEKKIFFRERLLVTFNPRR